MGLLIHEEKINEESAAALIKLCPFGALSYENGKLSVSPACRMCRLCIRKGPAGAITFEEEAKPVCDKSAWRGVAAVAFENGASLRFEYVGDTLALAVTVPSAGDAETLRGVLAAAHPDSRSAFRMRSGWRAKTGRAVFVVRLAAREVTTPAINAVFSQLWRAATEIGGVR